MKFNTVFSPPPKVASPHGGVSMVDESAIKDTDINCILKRYNAGDASVVRSTGFFGDVSNAGDLASAMEQVRLAKEEFEALPSGIRARFGNDPRALLEFVADSANDEEAIRLGLKVRRVAEKTLEEKIVDGVTSAMQEVSAASSTQKVGTENT